MSYLLDTSICSAYLKGDGRVFNRFIQHSGRLYTSSIVVGELYAWVLRGKTKREYAQELEDLLQVVRELPVDLEVARQFGATRAGQFDRGRPTPEIDLLIACTALVHDPTLVTHNGVDFADVPGLRTEDWLA